MFDFLRRGRYLPKDNGRCLSRHGKYRKVPLSVRVDTYQRDMLDKMAKRYKLTRNEFVRAILTYTLLRGSDDAKLIKKIVAKDIIEEVD